MKITFLTSVLGSLVLLAGGCATRKSLPPGLHTQARSAGGVKIRSIGLLPAGAGLLVHGTVERQFGYFGSIFRHLDLEVCGPSGELLAEQPIRFFPNPIPHSRFGAGRAGYSVQLPALPPPNSTIRVVVDCAPLSQCKLASTAK